MARKRYQKKNKGRAQRLMRTAGPAQTSSRDDNVTDDNVHIAVSERLRYNALHQLLP